MDFTQIASIKQTVDAGQCYDPLFASSLNSATASLMDIHTDMASLDVGDASDAISPYLDGATFGQLATHVEDNLSSAIDTLSLHNSYSGMERLFGNQSVCPSLNEAFGGFLAARSALVNLSTLRQSLDTLRGLKTAFDTAGANLSAAEAAFARGEITAQALSEAQHLLSSASNDLTGGKGAVNDHAQGLAATLGGASAAIQQQLAFVQKARTGLANLASAFSLSNMFSDACSKTILGAIGSNELLGKLG